ncbi:MAG: metalloregulator ArsR/SmtB family transcription factor [Pyrinomonadaceae bacterium]
MGDRNLTLELLFNSLADRTRLRLLNLLRDDELCVCYFVEVLKMTQPKISRHLGYLRRAGLVTARKQGKWIHYERVRPSDPGIALITDAVTTWLNNDPEMRHDRELLLKVCRSPNPSVTIKRAPRPALLSARTDLPHPSNLQNESGDERL